MKKNMGIIDKTMRILLAVLIGILLFTEAITGTVAIILGIVSLIFIATAFASFCPLYAVSNINTCKIKR